MSTSCFHVNKFLTSSQTGRCDGADRFYLHDHAEHDENVPQSDENPEVSEAEQELSDVVPYSRDRDTKFIRWTWSETKNITPSHLSSVVWTHLQIRGTPFFDYTTSEKQVIMNNNNNNDNNNNNNNNYHHHSFHCY